MTRHSFILVVFVVHALIAGCKDSSRADSETDGHDESPPAMTNRIDVPPAVRQNLGITFATVELRPVQNTLRMPGEFELRPEARREYRAMIAGRVNLIARQFDSVTPDTLLFTIDSPDWRDLQHDAVESAGRIKLAQAALDVATAEQSETEKAAQFVADRLERLKEAGTRNVELESQLSQLENQLPRLATAVQAKHIELEEANVHFRSLLRTLVSVSGISAEKLMEADAATPDENISGSPRPLWATLENIPVLAGITGVVSAVDVTDGGWVETGGLVMTAVDPQSVRFEAHALQSDMERLRDGQPALIVPPQGGSLDIKDSIEAVVSVGFEGTPGERTIPVYAIPSRNATWSRPGVSAFLEVFTGGGEAAELAIPMSAVVRDGLRSVYFRRSPDNPNQVIRIEADLGINDGKWVVVKSGLKSGDEVVLDGAYQLMLASSATSTRAGHFHSDGTFHEGED